MKPIKFNLSYGNEQIKTLAELKENCNIDMLLETHSNGLLVRWLTAHGETEKAQKVSEIKTDDKQKALEQLFETLFGSFPTIAQQAAAELFVMRNKEIKRLENYNSQLHKQEKRIISDYHKGYDTLIENLKKHSENYIALKADMITLYDQYRELLRLDKERFYQIFKEDYPLVLLALMANIPLREFINYAGETVYNDVWNGISKYREREPENIHATIKIESKEQLDKFKADNNNKVFGRYYKYYSKYKYSDSVSANDFNVGDYYIPMEDWTIPCTKRFVGTTEQYWKVIVPKKDQQNRINKCMIISMHDGNFVRNCGKQDEELSAKDINGKFFITEEGGIDYKCNNYNHQLIYMEV